MPSEAPAIIPIPATFTAERVTHVHHWTDSLMSLRCTRSAALRFEAGQFAMMGLMVDGRPLVRAYSIASAPWDEELEFFSIKIQHGPLTSRLQHVVPGDTLVVAKKLTGTLTITNLEPGGTLWLLGTGTGLAPFLSILQSPETYERYDRVVLSHTVRRVADLAYREVLEALPKHEWLGELIAEKFTYYPAVTREPFPVQDRITKLVETGRIFEELKLPELHPSRDRVMLCGSEAMNADCRAMLEWRGFTEGSTGERGTYVLEKAFVDKG
ncbi:MAG: ferredoxin--NADP reductase [Polyangiaceae bacterium]